MGLKQSGRIVPGTILPGSGLPSFVRYDDLMGRIIDIPIRPLDGGLDISDTVTLSTDRHDSYVHHFIDDERAPIMQAVIERLSEGTGFKYHLSIPGRSRADFLAPELRYQGRWLELACIEQGVRGMRYIDPAFFEVAEIEVPSPYRFISRAYNLAGIYMRTLVPLHGGPEISYFLSIVNTECVRTTTIGAFGLIADFKFDLRIAEIENPNI